MRHRVTGVDRESRKPVELVIDAESAADAARDAATRGLIVERVDPLLPNEAADALAHSTQRTPILIELTAKRWKRGILIFAVVTITGVLLGAAGLLVSIINMRFDGPGATVAVIGGAIAAIGFAGSLVYQFLAWWHHG